MRQHFAVRHRGSNQARLLSAILLRALADIMDPKNTPAAKAAAESRRQYAVQLLHMAVDMAMNDAEGRA